MIGCVNVRLILPENPNFNSNYGEEKVYKFLKENMPLNSITYYNYSIDGKQFDFCIAIEGMGVLVIEVKSYKKENILGLIDNKYIKLKSGVLGRAPYLQAREYAERLWEKSKQTLDVDIPILPVSWFTNLTRLDFKELELHKVGDEELTLFKEDLDGTYEFEKTLKTIFEFGKRYNKKGFLNLNSVRFNEFRTIFETEATLPRINKNINRCKEKKFYSILKVFSKIDEIGKRQLLDNWSRGSKLYLITDDKDVFRDLKSSIIEKLNFMKLDRTFKETANTDESFVTYNFNIYCVNYKLKQYFEILDGFTNMEERFESYSKTLIEIDKKSYFNLDQYLVEHSDNKNILVKAGAGTGKTHTMISRLMYLIYINKYSSDDLIEKIIMITFTNEAANSMRDKIKQEFMNYYMLTKDIKFIYHINSVINMRISTIHSLIKSLVEEYGYLLGYGSDISIINGVMDRREGLNKHLNSIILNNETDPIIDKDLNMNYFDFERFIIRLINKIEGRNIDFLNDNVDFGSALFQSSIYPELDDLIKEVMHNSEENTRVRVKNLNKIILSQLLLELKMIIGEASRKGLKSNIDYMFIDEFQDTDNAQIDLIKELYNNMNFKLFIVGDIKQCIYRFRGAEEDAFRRLIGNHESSDWNEYKLRKNYRTNKLLLDKYEDAFDQLGNKNLLLYDKTDDKLISGTGKMKKEPIKIVRIKEIEKEFEEKFTDCLLDSYEELSGRIKLGEKKNIGILVRTNKQLKEIIDIGNKKVKEGILNFHIKNPSIGKLYSLESTIDLYKLVIALLYNKNPKYLINLYTTSYINSNLNLWHIYKVSEESGGKNLEVYNQIKEMWPLNNWEKYIDDLRKETTLMVLREIIYELKPWNNYAMQTDGTIDSYKSKFYKDNLDLLFEKMCSNSEIDYLTLPKIEAFLKIMITTGIEEESRVQEIGEENINVTCTTIHKAKGLEYDVVIIPYTNLEIDVKNLASDIIIKDSGEGYKIGYKMSNKVQNNHYQHLRSEESIDQQKEEIRILYVALTRAKDKVVLFKYEGLEKHSLQHEIGGLYI